MSRPRPTAGAASARLLGLLAVLLGLLAMHGLASAHHATAAAAAHVAAPVVVADQPDPAHGTTPLAASAVAAPSALPTGSLLGVPPDPVCEGACPEGLAAVCAAVLAATAAAAVLARAAARRCLPPAHRACSSGDGAHAPPRRHLPRPDPVTELCVSRT